MSPQLQTQLPTTPVICNNFIAGEWVTGQAGKIEVISPYNGKKIGEVSVPTTAQINQAIDLASEAQVAWGRTPIKERSQVLFNFRNILLRDLDSISHLKSAECGKTFAEARAGLMKGIEVLEYAISIQNLDLNGKKPVAYLDNPPK